MDDLPLSKIQIPGPTLSSLLHRFSSSPSDVDGLLFGHFSPLPTTTLSDHPSPSLTEPPPLLATVTSFFCSSSTSSFFSPSGLLHLPTLRNLVNSTTTPSSPSSSSLVGWFSARRRTPQRPSMREAHVTSSLSSKIQFSLRVDNYTLPPCIFLLLTTPFQNPLIHTHEYRAYQFRISDESFEPKTLDVVNIGPAFRGHYSSFCPNSPFPVLNTDSMAEDRNCESEKEQREVDLGFDVGQLSRLVGPDAAKYTGEVEDLYNQMLAKLEGLARGVEKGSARVMEQVRIYCFLWACFL